MDVGAQYVHADALQKRGFDRLGEKKRDRVPFAPDAHRGEKAALGGAVARERRTFPKRLQTVRELAVQEGKSVLARHGGDAETRKAHEGGVIGLRHKKKSFEEKVLQR